MKKIGIIGGGILGLSLAYTILKKNKNIKVIIFEKESKIGQHQSGNNSGVMHCGLHYKPNSLKAKLAVKGIRLLTSYCREKDVSHEICGKVVVASNHEEDDLLKKLAENGQKNGLLGLKILSKSELKLREPNVIASSSLLVPEEGIVDYSSFMENLKIDILELGGEIELNCKVLKSEVKGNHQIIQTIKGDFQLNILINASGLYSDRNYTNLSQNMSDFKIIPFRGEYYKLKDNFNDVFNNLVYPVPNPRFPFLGVHFTRMINGSKEIGPNAVLAFSREGYKLSNFKPYDFFESITYKGLRSFILKNNSSVLREFHSSLSRAVYLKNAKKIIPSLDLYMLEKEKNSGVRAQAISKEGQLLMDFEIKTLGNQIHILNAPSPGATANLAISEYIIDNYLKL